MSNQQVIGLPGDQPPSVSCDRPRVRPWPLKDFDGDETRLGTQQVVLEFGGVTIGAEQVMRLHDGTLVPLRETSHEPVSIRNGNRVVARGDLVRVGGRLGIRITEIT